MVNFTENIKALISRRGSSQRKLAQAIGISHEALKHQLKTNNCPVLVLDKICEYFKVSPGLFIQIEDLPGGSTRNRSTGRTDKQEIRYLKDMVAQKDSTIHDKLRIIELLERERK